jgi:hypothetical protein
MALLKRKEHGLITWALHVDLVKAFDSVDRALMLDILRCYASKSTSSTSSTCST